MKPYFIKCVPGYTLSTLNMPGLAIVPPEVEFAALLARAEDIKDNPDKYLE